MPYQRVKIDIDAREFIRTIEVLVDCMEDVPTMLRERIAVAVGAGLQSMGGGEIAPPRRPGGPLRLVPGPRLISLLAEARAYSGGWEGDETGDEGETPFP